MLVREWMTENPITLGVDASVVDAAEVMRKQNIRQFPVINEDGMLAGIVSDRDIRDAMPSKYLAGDAAESAGSGLLGLRADDIMTMDPLSVLPTTPMDVVADMLARNKIGALPVVDDEDKLVGIISEVDVFRFVCSATGVARGGSQYAVRLEAKPGPLAELLDGLRDENVRFHSVMTSYDLEEAGYRDAYVRVEDLGPHTVQSLADYLSGRFQLLYYIDEGQTHTA